MNHIHRRDALKMIAGVFGLALVADSLAASEPTHQHTGGFELKIPESLKVEHDELHEELVRATQAGGKTGEAAKAVAQVLHPHFVKEEELAMPALGLLGALASGEVQPEMARVVELTDKLKSEMPTMLHEHAAIVEALNALADAAREENKPQAQHFAHKLIHHAKLEEEVTYPAAILVGEFIKLKLKT